MVTAGHHAAATRERAWARPGAVGAGTQGSAPGTAWPRRGPAMAGHDRGGTWCGDQTRSGAAATHHGWDVDHTRIHPHRDTVVGWHAGHERIRGLAQKDLT